MPETKVLKVGTEFLVNTQTASHQLAPTITGLTNGNFVVSWQDLSGTLGDASEYGIKAQIFSPGGAKIGTEFRVNTQTYLDQWTPTITSLSNGGFVVSWGDTSGTLGDSSYNSVKAQIYNAAGVMVGGEFLVNSQTVGEQIAPAITSLTNGGFVITWQDDGERVDGNVLSLIKGQIFNAAGGRVGGEFPIGSNVGNRPSLPSATGLLDGNFVVTWRDIEIPGALGGRAQIFTSDGVQVGPDFSILEAGDFARRPVESLANGGFVIAWTRPSIDYDIMDLTDVIAQIYGANGDKVGAEVHVATQSVNSQTAPAIAALPNGYFVISWEDNSQTLGDTSKSSIKAQVFSATGAKIGQEFLVNTETASYQYKPTITSLANGDFVISWNDGSGTLGDSYGASVKAQIFHVLSASPPEANDDTYLVDKGVITFLDDGVPGYLANDTYTAGPELTSYPTSQPTHGKLDADASGSFNYIQDAGFAAGDSFTYALSDADGSDSATVTLVLGGVSKFGTADSDTLTGTSSNDTLHGWLGADTMTGGDGSDLYYVDNAGDTVVEALNGGQSDTVRSGISHTLAANVENLELLYAGRAWGTGNALANVITGNGSDNVLRGMGGSDTLIGGGGNDTLDGGAGADAMTGGTGDDTYVVDDLGDTVTEFSGQGIDTVRSGISQTLGANVENLTLLYNGKCWGTGNALGNTIVGNIGDNVLRGMGGNDILTGGLGADAFVFNTSLNASNNVDAITDFSTAQGDVFWLDDAVFTALAPGALTAADFVTGTSATNAAQNVIYDNATGKLYYDADGTGIAAKVQFAVVAPNLSLTAGNFLVV